MEGVLEEIDDGGPAAKATPPAHDAANGGCPLDGLRKLFGL